MGSITEFSSSGAGSDDYSVLPDSRSVRRRAECPIEAGLLDNELEPAESRSIVARRVDSVSYISITESHAELADP